MMKPVLRLKRYRFRHSHMSPVDARWLARWLIWIQGLRCVYCAVYCPEHFDLDHVIPPSRGGNDAIENLVVACRGCNSAKNSSTPLHFWLRMRRLHGWRWQFGWAAAYTGRRPPFQEARLMPETVGADCVSYRRVL